MNNADNRSTLQYVLSAGVKESSLNLPLKIERQEALGQSWDGMPPSVKEKYLEQQKRISNGEEVAGREISSLYDSLKIDSRGEEPRKMSDEQICQTMWHSANSRLWESGPHRDRVVQEVQNLVSAVEKFMANPDFNHSFGQECNLLGVVVGAVNEYGKAQGQFDLKADEFRQLMDTAMAPLVFRRDELSIQEAGAVIDQLKVYYQ